MKRNAAAGPNACIQAPALSLNKPDSILSQPRARLVQPFAQRLNDTHACKHSFRTSWTRSQPSSWCRFYRACQSSNDRRTSTPCRCVTSHPPSLSTQIEPARVSARSRAQASPRTGGSECMHGRRRVHAQAHHAVAHAAPRSPQTMPPRTGDASAASSQPPGCHECGPTSGVH